jgi:outer membrane protein
MKPCLLLLAALLPLNAAQALDLLSIYDQAVQRDPQLRSAEANRNSVLENKPQSVARLLPKISIAGNIARNSVLSKFDKSSGTQSIIAGGANIGFWTSGASVSLSQPIYHHDYWVQLGQADSQIAQAEANYEAEQQNLMLRTAQAYFDILRAQDEVEFAQANKQVIERKLEQAKARFDVGLIAITDVNEAQASFDQATADLFNKENELDNAHEALREILGEFNNKIDRLVEEIPLNRPDPSNMDEWDKRAQESNLTIIAAQNGVEIAKRKIDIQFAGHLPTLDLVGTAAFSDTTRPRGIGTESQAVGMQLNIPLFQGGMVSSQVRQAGHDADAAAEQLDKQRRAVTRETKNAYRGILSSISQVTALKAAVISSQSALDASEAGFEVGTRTMVEVLADQTKLFDAKRNLARARYDYILNSLKLKKASSVLQRQDLELVNRWLRKNS